MSILDSVYSASPPFPAIFNGQVTDNYFNLSQGSISIYNLSQQQINTQILTGIPPEGSV